METADYDAGCEENLGLAIVWACGEVRVVHFGLGPGFTHEAILSNGIPDDLAADLLGFVNGKDSAEGGSEIERPNPGGERGSDGRVQGAVGVRACGQGSAQKRSEDVVALLLVGQEVVLQEEGEIAKAVGHAIEAATM